MSGAPRGPRRLLPDEAPLRAARTVAGSLGRALFGRTAVVRERARFGLMERLSRSLGFELYNAHSHWLEDEAFWAMWTRFPDHARARPDRKFLVHQLARSVRDLPGDTAECGVFEGGTSYVICDATARAGRVHHAFDSFEGLSTPAASDAPHDPRAFTWRAGDMRAEEARARANLARFGDAVRFHRGWIPARFPDVAERRFCFVHVDVDLEQPTYDSTAFFYERLVPGGILVNDDYGSHACPGARAAFDRFMADKPEAIVELPTAQAMIVKR